MDQLLNQVIENYKFVSVLGKGGMGIVYKAYDLKLDRYVAIKILSAHIVHNPKYIERFKREAKNQAQLTHPNIVTVYGFLEYENLLGIVMECAEGDSVDKLIYKYKRLHINDAVYIIKQTLVGMSYAHAKGFVHRDIKPSNIIVDKEGTVKIMDFGISKSLLDKGLTKTGSKIGTVLYMSPEQIRGDDITHATDIYSMGCTLYEMVVGEPPFYLQNDYEVMEAHLKKQPKKVSKIVQGIPLEFDEILNLSLQKEAGRRYPSCEEYLNDVIKIEKQLVNLQSEIFLHKVKNPKKKKIFSIVGFAFFLTVLGVLVYFAYIQADKLIKSNQLSGLKKYSIETLFEKHDDSYKFNSMSKVSFPEEAMLNSISFLDNSRGYIVGNNGGLWITKDSCDSWQKINLGTNVNLTDLHFDLNGKSIVVGDSNNIFLSQDYFNSFHSKKIYGDNYISGIEFKNVATGFIYGSKGLLARSDDGGENWERLTTNTSETLFDMDFVSDLVGFAVGFKGTVLRTDDGGRSWKKEGINSEKYLKAIDFYDEDNGVIVGGGGSIFVTSNGGDSWRDLSNKDVGGIHDVKYLSEKIIIAIGSRGKIIVSEDGGETWKSLKTDLFVKLNKIAVTPNNAIYVAGVNGTILKLR